MPTALPYARFNPTNLAKRKFTEYEININVAISIVHDHGGSWAGTKDNQTVYQGEAPDGRTFNVVVSSTFPTVATIITVDLVTLGGR